MGVVSVAQTRARGTSSPKGRGETGERGKLRRTGNMLTFEKQEKEKDPSRRPAEADATGVHSGPPPHVRPPADNV